MVKVIFQTGTIVEFPNATEFERRYNDGGVIRIKHGDKVLGLVPADAIVINDSSVKVKPQPQIRYNVNVDQGSHAWARLVDKAT